MIICLSNLTHKALTSLIKDANFYCHLTAFVVMLGHSSLSGTLINMTMSFVVMLGHVFLSGLLINMTMSFIVMLGHVYFSGMRPVGPGWVSGQDTLLKLPSTNHVCFCSL